MTVFTAGTATRTVKAAPSGKRIIADETEIWGDDQLFMGRGKGSGKMREVIVYLFFRYRQLLGEFDGIQFLSS
jgi:hypothetical protein